jgi:hypothetical protein
VNAIPDVHSYVEVGHGAPEPQPCTCGRLTCDWCGDEAYAPRRYSVRDHEEDR